MPAAMPISDNDRGQGFTLVELLVVITIVAALLAMLLPSLARARALTRSVLCAANLRQMQTSWLMFMQGNQNRIPYTRWVTKRPNWVDGLSTIYGDTLPNLYGTNVISPTVCPNVQRSFSPMYYTHIRFGYAINIWWKDAGPTFNDGESWNRIRNPQRYPWFVDPQVYRWGSGFMAAHRVPYGPIGGTDWGIGANHEDGTFVTASFADGSTKSVAIEDIRSKLDGPATFEWLSNR